MGSRRPLPHGAAAPLPPIDSPILDFNDLPPSSDDWSDSDIDDDITRLDEAAVVEEGEDQFTGKWKTLVIRVKQDPPDSFTRARMEKWGRPVSPFPEEARFPQMDLEDEDESMASPVQEPTTELKDVVHTEGAHRMSGKRVLHGEHIPPSASKSPEMADVAGNLEVNQPNISVASSSSATANPVQFSLSTSQADDDESNDDAIDVSLVKITSTDPHAAARAAAILKQHDYDCFTQVKVKSNRQQSMLDRSSRRSFARRALHEGGIVKNKAKPSRASTGVWGDEVFISGAPLTTLPDLLKEAETEFSFTRLSSTPRHHSHDTTLSFLDEGRLDLGLLDLSTISILGQTDGERSWTKEDWKLLDACLTDERLFVGIKLEIGGDGLSDVDHVSLHNVVWRYIQFLGGEDAARRLGPDWDREVIMQRAKALRKKQRSGKVAPPTIPQTPTSSKFESLGSSPDIEVPDFTPLKERLAFRRKIRSILPPPNFKGQNPSDEFGELRRLPLRVHQHSHLLGGVKSIGPSGRSSIEHEVLQHLPGDWIDASEDTSTGMGMPRNLTTPIASGSRVRGTVFSYLPSLSKNAGPQPSRNASWQPCRSPLPVDASEKRSRPHPALVRPKEATIIPRHWRSSSGSVKEIVENFEEMSRVNQATRKTA